MSKTIPISPASPYCGTREAALLAGWGYKTLLARKRQRPDIFGPTVVSEAVGGGPFQWHKERLIAAVARFNGMDSTEVAS